MESEASRAAWGSSELPAMTREARWVIDRASRGGCGTVLNVRMSPSWETGS